MIHKSIKIEKRRKAEKMNVKCRIRILKPKTCVHTYAGLKPETTIRQIVVLLYFTVQNQNLNKMRPTEQQLQLRQTD